MVTREQWIISAEKLMVDMVKNVRKIKQMISASPESFIAKENTASSPDLKDQEMYCKDY